MSYTRMSRWSACFLLALVLAACGPIKLASDYDEKLDQGVTDVQKKVEGLLTKIERSTKNPSMSYVASDYSAIKEDLNVLITRAEATPKNEVTVKQLYTLGQALLDSPPSAPEELKLPVAPPGNSLQKRHSLAIELKSDDVTELRTILRVNFRAILKEELAKKRGDAADSGKK